MSEGREERGAPSHPTADVEMHEGESFSSEAQADERDGIRKADQNTVVLTLKGESGEKVFRSVNPFRKITASSDISGYVANFAEHIGSITISDADTYHNVFSILLPTDVIPGTFTEQSERFIVQFFGEQKGELFRLDANRPFTLTVTEWGGAGGRARGWFSGELESDETGRVISINGSFDVGIE